MADPGAAVVIVHPATGELLEELHTQPPETLADALLAIRQRQAELREMQRAVEIELRRRVELRTGGQNRIVCFGDFEVTAHPTFERDWDGEELERVLRELIDQGVLRAADVTEVIRHETRVSRSEAASLLRRLGGPALESVRRCFTWRQKPGRVEVARSVALPTPEEVKR